MGDTVTQPNEEQQKEELRKVFAPIYRKQMDADGALDLFNPSADALLSQFTPSADGTDFPEYFSWSAAGAAGEPWPSVPCGPLPGWPIPRTCVLLDGRRGTLGMPFTQLFAGDLLWLFFHERMGVFRMIGALLDDFVSKGRFPLRPIGVSGFVLESMVRELKAGLSSKTSERDLSYRRVFGWSSEAGKRLANQDAPKNHEFSVQFHRLIQLALGYYQEKRLAVAIQASANPGAPSVATRTSIRTTIVMLRRTLDAFKYGRNHSHALAGIVWTLATLSLIKSLRQQLGIPEPFDQDDELIPAAYDLLLGEGGKKSDTNLYTAHRDCAQAGRNILLDVQAIDPSLSDAQLEMWLGLVEPTFERYRTAYRTLTSVDLGAPGTPAIEQEA